MKKLFFLLPLIMLMVAGCSDSNSPTTENGLYTYSHIEEEIIEVYGEGGEKLSENEWNDFTKEMYDEYVESKKAFMDIEMQFDDNKFILQNTEMIQGFPYRMAGDTIMITTDTYEDEIFETAIAAQVNNSTIEIQYISYMINTDDDCMGESVMNYGYLDEETQTNIEEAIPKLKTGEYVYLFFGRFHFKK
jgi:hypothetical protein